MCRVVPAVVFMLAVCVSAHADYLAVPLHDGADTLSLEPNSTFELDIVLTGEPGDVHDSAILDVTFSLPGLVYEAYAWHGDHVTGGLDDMSDPDAGGLLADPQVVTAATYSPTPAVDVHLENLTEFGTTFASGELVTLTLHVPADMPLGTVTITAVPDQFFDGMALVPSAPGPAFTLTIIPEPTSAVLLLAGLAALLRRRR